MSREYGSTLIQVYANNHGTETCGSTRYTPAQTFLMNWKNNVMQISSTIGLSDQSWLSYSHGILYDENIPAYELVPWVIDAIQNNVSLIQFEPSWYFFTQPRYWSPWPPTNEWIGNIIDNSRSVGSPTKNFDIISSYLLGSNLETSQNNIPHNDEIKKDNFNSISVFKKTGLNKKFIIETKEEVATSSQENDLKLLNFIKNNTQ